MHSRINTWYFDRRGRYNRTICSALGECLALKSRNKNVFRCFRLFDSLVPRHHHARTRKGSGDIGADSWFCKLSNHVISCIGFLLAHVRSRDGAHDQENAPMSPDPFPRERLGSGNETNYLIALSYRPP